LQANEAGAYLEAFSARDLALVGSSAARLPEMLSRRQPVADINSKLQQDVTARPDDGYALNPVASVAARYLAAIAMTAVATILAVDVDSKVTIPNLSRLRSASDHRWRQPRLGSVTVFGSTRRAGLQFLPD
jgi:hypothetical protein